MNENIFKNKQDYWLVAQNTKDLYLSEGSIATLLDYERVLDEMDIYAFKNWILGELVEGPVVNKYTVSCTFIWPMHLMPDPRGAKRLLPFDCTVKYKKTTIKVPVKVEDPSDFKPGTHVAKLIEKPIWLVEITMPKNLMNDIKTGAVELEEETIDLQDLEDSYQNDTDLTQYQENQDETQ